MSPLNGSSVKTRSKTKRLARGDWLYVTHAALSLIQLRMMPAASSGFESTISPIR